jgi:hypothetical protein
MHELVLDEVKIRVDGDNLIGWMSDWSAPFEHDWLGKGYVETVEHNSGDLGGFSYRLTDTGGDAFQRSGMCPKHRRQYDTWLDYRAPARGVPGTSGAIDLIQRQTSAIRADCRDNRNCS